jgi:metallo-beta-lactamase class B
LPALSGELSRLGAAARGALGEGLTRMTDQLARRLSELSPPPNDPNALAASMIAEMVGALALARAVADPAQSDQILFTARAAVKAKAGLDPAQVRYVLITHGHADHFGGATWFQQKYGAKVVLSPADWDMAAKARMPDGHPAPRRDVEAVDGQAITVGGLAFTPVYVPGHTPGSLAWIFPVSEGGMTHIAGLFGSTILRNDRLTTDTIVQELGSWEKWAAVTRRMKVDVELQNHPLFDGMPAKLTAIRARAPGQPNPFVVGEAAYGRFAGTVIECLKADIARKGGKVPG